MSAVARKGDYVSAEEYISDLIRKKTGVHLEARHHTMIESRLRARMHALGMKSLEDYASHLENNLEVELEGLISSLTTHYTYFFREFSQFEVLAEQMPRLVQEASLRPDRKIRIWSAACSRGQEMYSLAMFFDFHLKSFFPNSGVSYEIYGTDVDVQSVKIAQNGVYHRKELIEVPLNFLGSHWVRGTGDIADYMKAKRSLKEHLRFDQMNLLEIKPEPSEHCYDVIFCRNVFIYFQPKVIESVAKNLANHLCPSGLLFLGLSENLNGLNVPLNFIGNSVFAQTKENHRQAPLSVVVPAAKKPAKEVVAKTHVEPTRPLRVLCVDDSPSIIVLLKKILSGNGFEVVGVATNGKEAEKAVKELNPDLMTLDIHMPEMTGIEYLRANFKKGSHPPVVMVTSVSRDDAGLAGDALALGASDFVEKPSLVDMDQKSEEIRSKLRAAHQYRQLQSASKEFDQAFQKRIVIPNPDQKLRIFVSSVAGRNMVAKSLSELHANEPPTFILFDGHKDILQMAAKEIAGLSGKKVEVVDSIPSTLKADHFYVASVKDLFPKLKHVFQMRPTSILVLGHQGVWSLGEWPKAQILFEDGPKSENIKAQATDIVPLTSFAYMSQEFLARFP